MAYLSNLAKYGPWALVTGASDGIGRAFAYGLAEHGKNLVLVARNEEKLQLIAAELASKFNVQSVVIVCDLSQAGSAEQVFSQTKTLEIGLVVLAAGFGTSGAFLDNDLQDELNMIDLNCRAVAELSGLYGLQFKEKGSGGLILLGSLVGFQGAPRAANYAATKAYVQSLAEGLYHEFKGYNVDVLSVAPGPVRNGFAERANMQMGAADKPEDVAKAGLKAIGKKHLVRPGFMGKLLAFSLAPVPRQFRVMIMHQVMKGMAR